MYSPFPCLEKIIEDKTMLKGYTVRMPTKGRVGLKPAKKENR